MAQEDALGRARERYVELLKRSLLGQLYYDDQLRIRYLLQCVEGRAKYSPEVLHDIRRHEPEEVARRIAADAIGMPLDLKLENLGFPHTMLGRKRLDHLDWCVRTVIADGVPGDFIECGIWRGGAVVLMRALLEILEEPGRVVWAADSFQGIPPPTHPEDVAFGLDLSRAHCPMLAIPKGTVERTLADYDVLDDRVRFLEGWFKDTLPQAPIERLAILRLDGDIYESTMDALSSLYDKLVPGGFLIIDDHFVPTCKKAVEDFRNARGITEPLESIDWTGAYWRKVR